MQDFFPSVFQKINTLGTPTTFAKTINDDEPIIRWERWLGNFSPQQRCERVSAKFQEANENGTLDLIQNGWHNGQKVICTAIKVNGSCHTVLITLRPEDNSERILNDLIEEIGYSRKLGPLSHSGGESHIYYQIDLEAFWENIGKR